MGIKMKGNKDCSRKKQNIIMIDGRIAISNALIDKFKIYAKDWKFLSFTTVSEAIAINKTYYPSNILFLLNIGGIDFREKKIESYIVNIRKAFLNVPIILLADNEDLLEINLFSYFELNGFITTNYSTQLLISSMQVVIFGGTCIPKALISNHPSDIKNKNKIEKLTKRERDVALLLQGGLSNKVIASKLKISENTVKKHMSNIMEKLEVNSRTQAIIYLLSI
jgi:DNA-binding NarL/FixJ family response regulator